MTRKSNYNWDWLKSAWPYLLTGVATLALVIIGSIDKQNQEVTLSLDNFASSDHNVSVDQMSELYMVADLSDVLGLASAPDAASTYVSATSMYKSGLTSSGKIEKPNITDINTSRGIIEYEVQEGENINTIAAKYGASADQIRWSNGLNTVDVPAGTILKWHLTRN